MSDIFDAYIPFRGDGNEWEDFIYSLLVFRHGGTNLARVPATHGGDWGLDGYSYDGHAYQCYAAEECTTDELYRKQRTKMTVDVGKFIANSADIASMLAHVQKISRWCFVVPSYSSAKLLKHAAKKTKDIRDASLPYATADIVVHVDSLHNYRSELSAYISSARNSLYFTPPEVSDDEVERLAATQSDYVSNLRRKLSAQGNQPPRQRVLEQSSAYIRTFIAAEAVKAALHKDNPRAYAQVLRCGQDFKRRLEVFGQSNAGDANVLRGSFDELVVDIGDSVEALSRSNVELLGQGLLAQFLMDCTMEIS